MLQFFHCSQLRLKLAVCPSFTKITPSVYEAPIITSFPSILQMTKISLNTCVSRWEMEVAIGNEITDTIIAIRKDKVRYFELLELMNKFESARSLLCLRSNIESKSRKAENVKIHFFFCQKYLWVQEKKNPVSIARIPCGFLLHLLVKIHCSNAFWLWDFFTFGRFFSA